MILTRTQRQILGIDKWRDAKCKGSLCWSTGVGKTNAGIMAIERVLVKNPTVKVTIIVPTQPLKEQWESILESRQIDGDITVKIINSAIKSPFKCNFLILDEAHRYNASGFSKIFQCCKPHFILGLTATYERLDGKEKEIMDKYCPVCDTITLQEATENNWLSPYKEYKISLDVDLTEYNIATKQFLDSLSFFGFNWDTAMKALTDVNFQQQLAKLYNCDLKIVKANAYTFNRTLQFRKSFIANHPKKIEIAKKILKARQNCKCITFNSSIKQCNAYGFGYVVNAKKTKKENKKIIDEFLKCDAGVIHSSKMLIEGLDCPGLQVAIIAGFNSSKTAKIQSCGRVIRKEPNKQAEIFTLVLRNTVEEKWFAKATEGLNYIDIDESELTQVLNHQLKNKVEHTQEVCKGFRF